MARNYYSIDTSILAIRQIRAALVDKYGGGVTIHYETVRILVFSIPAISSKTFRFYKSADSTTISATYGDAYDGTTSVTNPIVFGGYAVSAFMSIFHLVLDDNFLFINYLSPSTSIYSCIIIIGKLTNNDFIAMGLSGYASPQESIGVNFTSGKAIRPITISNGFINSSNKLYKQPLLFVSSDNTIVVNGDGSFATIDGIFNISWTLSNTTLIKAANYLMSSSGYMWMTDGLRYLSTSLFIEF